MKYVLNIGFIVLICWLTFRLLFSGQEFSSILEDLHNADTRWIAVGLLLAFMFVAGESCIIYYMLRVLGQKTKFLRCLKYSFIGFFFSDITPSASGGQPAQMYYMKKDGVKIGFSTLIMLLITIAYKAVLVILGLIFLIFNYSLVADHVGKMWWLLILGFALNIAFIAVLAAVFVKPVWARKAGIKIVNLLTNIKIIKSKNNQKYIEKITRICDTYTIGADYIKNNLHTVVNVFLITAVQRLSLFAITWIVYKSYGLSGYGILPVIALQTMIGISVEMLPLPGAAGITEGCFMIMFDRIFGKELMRPALLLSRGMSFYAVLIAGGLVTFASHIIIMRRDKQIYADEGLMKTMGNEKKG
ncbi:MAG: lysylphosphatidylglycerol synthase transmembrane domain-containing protein [Ruminococcus sp.]|nr:lysylphosphatidylglycerol synthase transmembrane domain-containing protein [Ruminococcus sp.]